MPEVFTTESAQKVSTSDATTTTAAKKATFTDNSYLFQASVAAANTDDYSEAAGYVLRGVFKNDGGTLSQVGTDNKTVVAESVAGWDVALDTNGTDIRVRVTGEAGKNIDWRVDHEIIEVGEHFK